MAEKEYTVVAPDGKEITLIGPVGASQEEIIAQAQKLYKPSAVAAQPVPKEQGSSIMDRVKALYEVPATVATSAVAPFLGAGKGIIQNIKQGTNERVDRPELAQEFVYQPKSPVSQDILESMGKTFDAAKIPAYVPGAGQLATATKQSSQFLPSYARFAGKEIAQDIKAQPFVQEMASDAKKVGQLLKSKPTVEPTTGEIKSTVGQRYKEAFTPEPKPNYATAEQLEQVSQNLFTKAKQSGVELNANDFGNYMKGIQKDLRSEGYDPRTMPKVAVALEEMQKTELSKDLDELKTLRKFIVNAQKSSDLEEKRVGTLLKDRFDDYVATIPESSVTSGSKEGLKAWKEARDAYAKLSKAEIFDDMIEIAKLEKGKYSQAGIEQSLYNQLKNLAKNDKRMRMFTAEEQAAIKKAAEGTDLQNTLKFIGKFAPTSTVSSILPLLATSASAPVGILGTAAAIGSRAAAAQMRKNQVQQLANLMRGTVNPEWQAEPKPVNEQFLKMLRMNQGE